MKKIGIIGAMEIEVEKLKAEMENCSMCRKAGMEFFEGKLDGADVVVVKSGIGKVNAAVCTQILADLYGVDAVINTGIAGSLDAQIDICDIVLSTDVVHHDMDVAVFGYEPGQIPQMDVFSFRADPEMTAKAEAVCREEIPSVRVYKGRIVSGDQFVSDKAVKDRIIGTFHALCTEMEGAAIAQTAYLNNIPFLIIRAISDKADDSAVMDYPAFEKQAAENSVHLTKGLVARLTRG